MVWRWFCSISAECGHIVSVVDHDDDVSPNQYKANGNVRLIQASLYVSLFKYSTFICQAMIHKTGIFIQNDTIHRLNMATMCVFIRFSWTLIPSNNLKSTVCLILTCVTIESYHSFTVYSCHIHTMQHGGKRWKRFLCSLSKLLSFTNCLRQHF